MIERGNPEPLHRVDEVHGEPRHDRGRDDAAQDRPHVPQRDVAPPVAVEAEEDEDAELDGDDEIDRLLEEPLVPHGDAGIEAQPEGEVPGDSDQACVDRELPQLAPRRKPHAAAFPWTACSTHSTTVFCVPGPIPAHIGKARFSAAACSVTGSEPGA